MLTDNFGRTHTYLRISLTDKCNLRCMYCMPYDLPRGTFANAVRMTAEEIDKFASLFVELGIKKIRLTGGEPLIRKDAREIFQLLSKYPVKLAITTNGILVDEYIDAFKEAGIKSVNVSLDSLNSEKSAFVTKRGFHQKIVSNILLLLKNNFRVKVNVVVMKGVNDNEIIDFVAWTKDLPVELRFIEFMPFAGNQWKRENVILHKQILDLISTKFSVIKLEDEQHNTAKRYKVKNHQGSFAVISTVSEPFCENCNRIRLTADGKLKNCLFSNREVDLLTPFRQGEDVVPLIFSCIKNKFAERGGQNFEDIENRSMVEIGG